jgi:hypothetical protein
MPLKELWRIVNAKLRRNRCLTFFRLEPKKHDEEFEELRKIIRDSANGAVYVRLSSKTSISHIECSITFTAPALP